jgi:hypothetical protein
MRGAGLFRAAAQAAATAGRAVAAVARGAAAIVANTAYSPTMQAKAAQGATEITNMLYSQSPAYSPVTADKAVDRAAAAGHRAQFQQRDASRGLDR